MDAEIKIDDQTFMLMDIGVEISINSTPDHGIVRFTGIVDSDGARIIASDAFPSGHKEHDAFMRTAMFVQQTEQKQQATLEMQKQQATLEMWKAMRGARRATPVEKELATARRKFKSALKQLEQMADDFSGPDSQQKFMLKLREVSALRDQLWYSAQREK